MMLNGIIFFLFVSSSIRVIIRIIFFIYGRNNLAGREYNEIQT